MVWEDRYENQYGFWRSWTKAVIKHESTRCLWLTKKRIKINPADHVSDLQNQIKNDFINII
jgi:hypothetical protein